MRFGIWCGGIERAKPRSSGSSFVSRRQPGACFGGAGPVRVAGGRPTAARQADCSRDAVTAPESGSGLLPATHGQRKQFSFGTSGEYPPTPEKSGDFSEKTEVAKGALFGSRRVFRDRARARARARARRDPIPRSWEHQRSGARSERKGLQEGRSRLLYLGSCVSPEQPPSSRSSLQPQRRPALRRVRTHALAPQHLFSHRRSSSR
jgi:hypothetical protein